jgi:hypothetical protein
MMSIGIRVHRPLEQDVNRFVEQAFETRLHHFVLISGAYIVAQGGLGTLLDDLAALAGASPARHFAHFRRPHVEGLGRRGKRDDVAPRIRTREPAGHAYTVLPPWKRLPLSGITTRAG